MSVLAIVKPLPIAAIGGTLEGAARLITPSPREAAVCVGGGDRTIDVDLGAPVALDTLFLGYSNASGGAWHASCGVSDYTSTALPDVALASTRLTRARHYLAVLAVPVVARYVRFSAAAVPAGLTLGLLAVGLALRPALGHEWGAGRFVTDTGSATRLQTGGFGLASGSRSGGWQWTLAELTDEEVDAMYGLQLDVGTSSPLLVVEDPDPTAGLNERIHWGVLTKLDPNERRAIADVKWDMRIEDWA